jgi:hypothetical protein
MWLITGQVKDLAWYSNHSLRQGQLVKLSKY